MGWQPTTQHVEVVASIHNPATERAWAEVLEWEKMHCSRCKEPKLRKLIQRSDSPSPRARLQQLWGHRLPFKRQDWIISRCGADVRYVVEFRNAAPSPGMPLALQLDVRPALHSFQAAWDTLRRNVASNKSAATTANA